MGGKRGSIRIDCIDLSTQPNQFEMLVSGLIHERTLKTVLFRRKLR